MNARVYRHQLRPVITQGAEAMDAIFDQAATAGHPPLAERDDPDGGVTTSRKAADHQPEKVGGHDGN